MSASAAGFAAPLADAAQPIVVGDCGATVSGSPGQPVSVDLGAVLNTGNGPVVPIGAIPKAGADTLDAASAAKDHKGPLTGLLGGVTGTLQKVLSGGCDVVAKTTNKASAPVQDATKPATEALKPATKPVTDGLNKATGHGPSHKQSPPQKPPQHSPTKPDHANKPAHQSSGAGGAPSEKHDGLPKDVPLYGQLDDRSAPVSPASLYSTAPQDAPGFGTGQGVPGNSDPPAAQYDSPGRAPAFGKLPGQADSQSKADPVRTAGNASTLAAHDNRSGGDIGVPLLIAVLAMTGVTAGLVRTWVLKKATR